MLLKSILTPNLCFCSSTLPNKKKVLEHLSQAISDLNHGLHLTDVLHPLQKRERLGSTVVGHGVAIPHARVTAIDRPICALLTLKNAVYFDEEDRSAVDIVFVLLVPEEASEEHVTYLAELADKLQHKDYRDLLRQADSDQTLYQAAVEDT